MRGVLISACCGLVACAGPNDAPPAEVPADAPYSDASNSTTAPDATGPGSAGEVIEADDVTAPDSSDSISSDAGSASVDAQWPDLGACGALPVLRCGQELAVHVDSTTADVTPSGCALWPSLEVLPSTEPVLAFVPELAAVAAITLVGDATASESLFVRVMGGSDCDPTTCLALTATTTLEVTAGSPTFLAVGSWLGETGDGVVRVDCCVPACTDRACGPDGCGGTCGTCAAPDACADGQCTPCVGPDCVCAPSCQGRVCGPDGCGGSCGQCPAGALCASSGLCVVPTYAGNDTCASAAAIPALPFEAIATVDGASDDLSPNNDVGASIVPRDGCVRSLPGGRDVVYRYTAPHALTLAARLTALTDAPCGVPGAGPCPPALLYATRQCPASVCADGGDFLWRSAPDLRVALKAGELIYLVVDGHSATDIGAFQLSVREEL